MGCLGVTSNSVDDLPGNQAGTTGGQIPGSGIDPMRSSEYQYIYLTTVFWPLDAMREIFGAVRFLPVDYFSSSKSFSVHVFAM